MKKPKWKKMKSKINSGRQIDHQHYPDLNSFIHKLKNSLHSTGINLEVVKTKINNISGKTPADIQKHLDIIGSELSNMVQITNNFAEFLNTRGSK